MRTVGLLEYMGQQGPSTCWEPLHAYSARISADRVARAAEAADPASPAADLAVHRHAAAAALCHGRPALGGSVHPGIPQPPGRSRPHRAHPGAVHLFYEAEVYRLKGALLLARSAEKHAEAETCFRQAIDIARQQQAKSLELRAATSLSRLWQRQDKRVEAQQLLAPIYSWFTEGFDTADLQEGKTLLEELAG